jgi:superfamily II DNA/RNA helicase
MAVRRPTEDQTFAQLGVPAVLVDALAAQGITTPRPIQAATLPDALAGRDVLGRGRTGSGKTYAFVLPVLARLAARPAERRPGRPRALILAPTRELAAQIEASIEPLGRLLGLRTLTVFGGVGANPQIRGLRNGVDVLVACPGRLLDHVGEGHARLDAVEITVLDEADHMADLGFLPSVRRLLDRTPAEGQRMLFSATLDAGVDVVVRRYLTDPVTHSVDSALSPISTMSHHVLHIDRSDRLPVLVDLTGTTGRSVVFTRTKYGAKALARRLVKAGVPAVELHGNLGQNARLRNLQAFSDGTATTLVATDIAARGIHVDDVALVIHADPPVEHKAYLHRSGRTARGDAGGTVITLMTDEQTGEVRELTRKAGITATTNRVRPGDSLLTRLAPAAAAVPAQARASEPVAAAVAPAPVAVASAPSGGADVDDPARRRPSRRRRKPGGVDARSVAHPDGGRSGEPGRSGGRRSGRSEATGRSGGARSGGAGSGGGRSGAAGRHGDGGVGARSGGRSADGRHGDTRDGGSGARSGGRSDGWSGGRSDGRSGGRASDGRSGGAERAGARSGGAGRVRDGGRPGGSGRAGEARSGGTRTATGSGGRRSRGGASSQPRWQGRYGSGSGSSH